MRWDNLCIFTEIEHVNSGKAIDPGMIVEGIYVEEMALTAPKLMLTLKDNANYLKDTCKIREYDELRVNLGDVWREDGENMEETFTVLTVTPRNDNSLHLNCLAKPLYALKTIADKTRVFSSRGVSEVVNACTGLGKVLSKFAVVENYHIIAGERPSTMLTQLAQEHGAQAWLARGKFHLERFGELFKREPAFTFHHGKINEKNAIIRYTKPSGQMQGQEANIRTATGWNEVEGRVKTSPDNPIMALAKSKPTVITGSPSRYVLGNGPVATKTAIDFTTLGNLSLTAGQALKLLWHTPHPEAPLNEGLPDKVVVETVAHWYQSQRFYTRVKGAVALEPF